MSVGDEITMVYGERCYKDQVFELVEDHSFVFASAPTWQCTVYGKRDHDIARKKHRRR